MTNEYFVNARVAPSPRSKYFHFFRHNDFEKGFVFMICLLRFKEQLKCKKRINIALRCKNKRAHVTVHLHVHCSLK